LLQKFILVYINSGIIHLNGWVENKYRDLKIFNDIKVVHNIEAILNCNTCQTFKKHLYMLLNYPGNKKTGNDSGFYLLCYTGF
jgi:hypothetical protein